MRCSDSFNTLGHFSFFPFFSPHLEALYDTSGFPPSALARLPAISKISRTQCCWQGKRLRHWHETAFNKVELVRRLMSLYSDWIPFLDSSCSVPQTMGRKWANEKGILLGNLAKCAIRKPHFAVLLRWGVARESLKPIPFDPRPS